MPLQTHVAVAKAGVDALSANAAIEFGPHGVTSNVIAPGGIQATEGLERLSRAEDRNAAAAMVPLGRHGTVKEIADATVYLFSDAGTYVNGESLVGESFFLSYLRPLSFVLHPLRFFLALAEIERADLCVCAANTVDGGAWRTQPTGLGKGPMSYPAIVLNADPVQGVRGMKKDKSKL